MMLSEGQVVSEAQTDTMHQARVLYYISRAMLHTAWRCCAVFVAYVETGRALRRHRHTSERSQTGQSCSSNV